MTENSVLEWTCISLALLLFSIHPLCAQSPSSVAGKVESPPAPAGPESYQPSAAGFDLSRFVKLEGQLRTRYEFFDPFSYSAANVDRSDDAVLLRTRLGVLFDLHRNLSAKIQIQDSRIWGEEGASTPTSPSGSVTTSIDNVDLHQAYVDLKNLFEDELGEGTLTLRPLTYSPIE